MVFTWSRAAISSLCRHSIGSLSHVPSFRDVLHQVKQYDLMMKAMEGPVVAPAMFVAEGSRGNDNGGNLNGGTHDRNHNGGNSYRNPNGGRGNGGRGGRKPYVPR